MPPGASPYGASTIAGGKGERMPSENELAGARFQGEHATKIGAKLAGGSSPATRWMTPLEEGHRHRPSMACPESFEKFHPKGVLATHKPAEQALERVVCCPVTPKPRLILFPDHVHRLLASRSIRRRIPSEIESEMDTHTVMAAVGGGAQIHGRGLAVGPNPRGLAVEVVDHRPVGVVGGQRIGQTVDGGGNSGRVEEGAEAGCTVAVVLKASRPMISFPRRKIFPKASRKPIFRPGTVVWAAKATAG